MWKSATQLRSEQVDGPARRILQPEPQDRVRPRCPFAVCARPPAAATAAAGPTRQGLTLVHFSAQQEPFFVTEATAFVHFSAQPAPFLRSIILNSAHKSVHFKLESGRV